jgi:hypothetical protein
VHLNRSVAVLAAWISVASCAAGGGDSTPQQSALDPPRTESMVSASSSSAPPTVTSASEAAFEPAPRAEAEFSSDGRVAWNASPSPDSPSERRYVVDGLPPSFEPRRAEQPAGNPTSRTVTALLAAGTFSGEPYLSVSVTTAEQGAPKFDLDLETIKGDRIDVGGVPSVLHTPAVGVAAVTLVVDTRRVDVLAQSGADDFLIPVAESLRIDGDMASVLLPTGTNLAFVGAYSPAWLLSGGEGPIDLTSSASTELEYVVDEEPRADLTVSLGRVTGYDSLVRWLDARAEPITLAGTKGWIVRIPDFDRLVVEWMADGRRFKLGVQGVDEETVLALAASVRPATADEWEAIALQQ